MTGTLDENDVRACDDCHLHGTALRIREAVAEIKRLKAELKALQAAPLAQLALYAAWLADTPAPPGGVAPQWSWTERDSAGYPVRRSAPAVGEEQT